MGFIRAKAEYDGDDIPNSLIDSEKWWRDQYDALKAQGYELRLRFRPGWTPSWIRKKKDPILREDGHPNLHPKVIDAVRTADATRVALKRVRKGSKELVIIRYLTSEKLLNDPRNHTVPLLDVISKDDGNWEFMVMPLLINFCEVPFDSVDEVIDFMTQMLEGLSFLHENGIAHRDYSILNIMMDGSPIFPRGFHHGAPYLEADGVHLASPRRRRDVSRVMYHFTDFGISSHFDDPNGDGMVTGNDCMDKDLHELYQDAPYDAFPVDIFLLGNVCKQVLVKRYETLSFLKPLTDAMTQEDPKARPTVDACLLMLNEIVGQHPSTSLLQLLIRRNATRFDRFLCILGSFRRQAGQNVKSYLCSGFHQQPGKFML